MTPPATNEEEAAAVDLGRLALFAKVTLGLTLAVILWGAFVRASGSGAGCGSHWPTCNGEIIPHPKSFKTLVEVTHRITSGLALLAVVGLAGLSFRWLPRGHPARTAAALSLFFMLTEAAVGAGIVLLEYVAGNASVARACWMAVHLTNTFLLLAALGAAVTLMRPASSLTRRPWVPADFALLVAGLGLLVVGVSGAIAALGDTLFPAASLAAGFAADASPTAHVLLRLRVFHPVLAVSGAALTMWAASRAARLASAEVRQAALFVYIAVAVQVVGGFLNLALLAPTAMQLLHLFSADVVWLSLVRLFVVARFAASPADSSAGRAPVAAEPSA